MANIIYSDGSADMNTGSFEGNAVHAMQRLRTGESAEICDGDGTIFTMERIDSTTTVFESIFGTCSVTEGFGFRSLHAVAYEDGAASYFETWTMAVAAGEAFALYGIRF